MEEKNKTMVSVVAGKASDKIQPHSLKKKNLSKLSIEGNFLSITIIFEKCSGEILNLFPLSSGTM